MSTTRKNKYQKYRRMLEARVADLLLRLRDRESIAVEKSADELDDVQLTNQREFAIHNLNRETRLLRQARAALRRMDEGDYGICLNCEEPILPKRLDAIPWALYCVRCQEAVDRGEIEAEVGAQLENAA